jgi:hypothetical protein
MTASAVSVAATAIRVETFLKHDRKDDEIKLKPGGRMIALIQGTETQMTRYRSARIFAFTAALVVAALAFVPHPISADLGAGWNCSQNVFLTSCRFAQQ